MDYRCPATQTNRYILLMVTLICGCAFFAEAQTSKHHPINLFIGTSGDNGQVDPAACVPFGMARVCPDSKPRSHSGYDFAVRAISGFSANRMPGIGCGGNGGNFSIQPDSAGAVLIRDSVSETAVPGYYRVRLNNGVDAELTATSHIAVERYHFPSGTRGVLTLDVTSSFTSADTSQWKVTAPNELQGFVQCGTTCGAGKYKLYFDLRTDRPFVLQPVGKHRVEMHFAGVSNKSVEVRIAMSPVDVQSAAGENDAIAKMNFVAIKKEAAAQWASYLDRIDISGGTADDRTIFYTSLYRTLCSPFDATYPGHQFLGTDGLVKKAQDFRYYSSWSLWDSYRTKFPLFTLLCPDEMKDMARSLCQLYRYGKNGWATAFESGPTVRTEHAIAVLLDVASKGISTEDLELAWPGMKREVASLNTTRPDQAMEAVIDYWALGGIAAVLHKEGDARLYGDKAWSIFNTIWNRDFRVVDSSYAKMGNNGLYQGSRWQYRWTATQYIDSMAASVGGKEVLAGQLTYFYDHSLNNQGNEVGNDAPFIFNRLGRPDLTQKTVTKMLTQATLHRYGGNAEYDKPYIKKIFSNEPKGFLPEMDEDDGTMGAWYVMASMGLFPLVVGDPNFEISSPVFDRVTLHFPHGKKLIIKVVGRKAAEDIICGIRFNGRPLADHRLKYQDLVKGGELELQY